MIQLIFWTALFILFLLFAYYWIWGMFKGAPYYPSKKSSVEQILKQLNRLSKPNIAELGAGDGRVAIAAAKKGYKVTAFEINPILTIISRVLSKLHGVELEIRQENFLNTDLSEFNVLITYLYPGIMNKLEEKINREMKPGSVIISNTFRFKELKPISEENKILIYKL